MNRARFALLAGSLLALLTMVNPSPLLAQGYVYQFGSYPWTTPIPVAGGYVDAANGNLHIEIPIASVPERGHVPFVARLVYDSHIWQQVTVNSSTSWQPTNVPTSWGGWRLITSAGTGLGVSYTETEQGECQEVVNHHVSLIPYYKFTNWSYTAADGHSIPFNTVQTTGYEDICGSGTSSSNGISSDASGYHLYVTNWMIPVVYAPDGTQVYPNVEDTNGNYYSVPNGNGDVTDTLGRMPITTSVNGATITYQVLSSQGGTPYTSNFVVTTESIPVNTSFGQSGVTEFSGNITVVQSIGLPDGTSYSFTYDQGSTGTHYGTLTQMTLPTTGIATYGYSNFKDAYNNQNIWVESYSLNGGNWSYAPSVLQNCGTSCSQNCTTCTQQLTATAPSGEKTVYAFNLNTGAWMTSAASYDTTANGGGLLQTISTAYNFSNLPYVLPTSTTTILPVPGSSINKQTTYTFDSSNLGNITQQTETNFYSSSSAAYRTTAYTYLSNSDNNMVNKKQTVGICGGSGPCTSYLAETQINYDTTATSSITGVFNHDDTNFGTSYTARGNPTSIQGLNAANTVTTTMTYDMTGQVTSSTDNNSNVTKFSYADNYFNDSSSGPTSTTPAGKTNAYVTQITLPTPFSWTLSFGYYLGTGQLAEKTDQNGVLTTNDYMDPWNRPTKSAVPLASNVYSWKMMSYAASSEVQADSYQGIADALPSTNCTSCRHDQSKLDSFGRPLSQDLVTDPDGATTTTVSYNATGRVSSVTNPERSPSDPTAGSDTYTYDGLGRTTKVTHSDGNSSSIYYGAAVTGTGAGGISPQLCSSSTYGLGYPVLAVDEAGKKREVWSDAFGRPIEVDEQDN